MVFEGYSISIRGKSHDTNGKPCQDSSYYYANNDYAVAVVSDGHGSSKYYRSDIGSKLAVEAAFTVVSSCMGTGRDDFIEGIKNDPYAIMNRVTDAVLTEWTDLVKKYDSDRPLSEEEQKLEGSDDRQDVLRAYGATLICGVMSDGIVFGFQIGDGEFVAVNDESEDTMPMPEDPDCFLNRTSSICSSDASGRFRHLVISESVKNAESDNFRAICCNPEKVSSVVVCTDGLSTSFNSDESLMRYCTAIPNALSSGSREILEENLKLRSCSNTCDDVSVSVVYRLKTGSVKIPVTYAGKDNKRQNRKNRKNKQKRKDRRHRG